MKNEIDFSSRDASGKVVFYVLLKKRNGIPLALFDDYWRNVHGPVCARLPGQHQYWQFHLAHNDGGYWQPVDGVKYDCEFEDQMDGIAELTFTSPAERDAWFSAASILMDDEHNLFSKAVGYVTDPGNSVTFVDKLMEGAPNGNDGEVRFQVFVQKADKLGLDEFRTYMMKQFAPAIKASGHVAKLRVHLLEEHDNSEKLPPAPGVEHYEPLEKQYNAAFEIAFNGHMDMETYFASPEYARLIADQSKYIKRINAFPVRDTYTFVYDSQMTMSGQRGSSVAAMIEQAGATNQLRDDIQTLMITGGAAAPAAATPREVGELDTV